MLDEITAALPSDLAEKVFAVMREWRERGRSVLFISHRLAEVTATVRPRQRAARRPHGRHARAAGRARRRRSSS